MSASKLHFQFLLPLFEMVAINSFTLGHHNHKPIWVTVTDLSTSAVIILTMLLCLSELYKLVW